MLWRMMLESHFFFYGIGWKDDFRWREGTSNMRSGIGFLQPIIFLGESGKSGITLSAKKRICLFVVWVTQGIIQRNRRTSPETLDIFWSSLSLGSSWARGCGKFCWSSFRYPFSKRRYLVKGNNILPSFSKWRIPLSIRIQQLSWLIEITIGTNKEQTSFLKGLNT